MLQPMTIEPLYIVLLGGPGAGKGTQGAQLTTYLGIPRVSSGDLFREHVRSRTDLGTQAKAYMDRGELVPDSITVAMVMERLGVSDCLRGAILDGFPRTLPQAEALENALATQGKRVRLVIDIQVPSEVMVERLGGRWMCSVCGEAFHEKFRLPKEAGRCDFCGNTLYQRDDDKIEAITRRVQVYITQTAPLEDFYRERHVLAEINGNQAVEAVFNAAALALQQRQLVGIEG